MLDRLARPLVRLRQRMRELFVIFCIGAVRALLRRYGYCRTCTILARTSPSPSASRLTAVAVRVLNWISAPKRSNGQRIGSCLESGLLKWWSLRWCNVRSDLKTGIQKDSLGGYRAHAWLIVAGTVVGENSAGTADFVPLWEQLSVESTSQRSS